MDQLAQRSVVNSIAVGGIEAQSPRPAERATALFIERMTVEERRAAGNAEMLR
jgi:hypothetical protein